jgi:hypothetical protein
MGWNALDQILKFKMKFTTFKSKVKEGTYTLGTYRTRGPKNVSHRK